MMIEQDFKYLNVPALLERKAWVASGDGKLVEDDQWSTRTKERLSALVRFFQDNNLLISPIEGDVSSLVLMFSQFNDDGKRFIRSGAPDKWLTSFDKSPSKPAADVSYMQKALRKLLA